MDSDLKSPVQAPLVTPDKSEGPDQMPDPFKPDNPPLSPAPPRKKQSGKGKKVLLILLVVALIAAVGGGVYYWQNRQVKEANARNQELTNQVAQLQEQVNKLEGTEQELEQEVADETAVTTDDEVIAAAKAYCQASVDPANQQAHVFTVVNSAGDKKVLYSADKGFATVNATCGTTAAPGATQTYYVKDSGGVWTIIHAGTLTQAVTTQYNIPTTFN